MRPQIFVTTILLVLLAVLQYKLWFSPDGISQFWLLKQNIAQQDQQNNILQARNDRVRAEIEDLKNGGEAIEEHARNDLGLIKSGESFYQIID